MLVVDDVVSNVEMIKNMLADSGLRFMSAANGRMALEILNHTIPDLILLDIRMPGLNGYEVAEEIRKTEALKQLPIIGLTAFVSHKLSDELIKNFDRFLFKPVSKGVLQHELMHFLTYTKLPQETETTSHQSLFLWDTLSEATQNNGDRILQVLESKFLLWYDDIKDGNMLFEIEDFAKELKQLANHFEFAYVVNYATQLLMAVEHINTERIQDLLIEFPTLVNTFKSLNNTH